MSNYIKKYTEIEVTDIIETVQYKNIYIVLELSIVSHLFIKYTLENIQDIKVFILIVNEKIQ